MDSSDLTRAQLDAIKARLMRDKRYLRKLAERMHEQGWPADDELYRLTREAFDAVDRLSMAAHYLSCKGQTGG